MKKKEILKIAKSVFDLEINALNKTKDGLNRDFATIVEKILMCNGKVIFSGMGKPGHICRKIAATLSSLGTPSIFIHPAEAMHGDLGMLQKNDLIILTSYSGESSEIIGIINNIKKIGLEIIAITGNKNSTLYKNSTLNFLFPKFEEACALNLAPTSSTTALLALGDAISVIVSRVNNFSSDDFGLYHPAGSLGKRLLTKVEHIMCVGSEIPVIDESKNLNDVFLVFAEKAKGVVLVTKNNRLTGLITDGDLRRIFSNENFTYDTKISTIMSKEPKTVNEGLLLVNAVKLMKELSISCLPVVNNKKNIVGLVTLKDSILFGI